MVWVLENVTCLNKICGFAKDIHTPYIMLDIQVELELHGGETYIYFRFSASQKITQGKPCVCEVNLPLCQAVFSRDLAISWHW